MTPAPSIETARLIRAYAQSALDENEIMTADDQPLCWAIVATNASEAEACCHMGRALICLEDGLSDPPYRLGGDLCDDRKTEIARRLGMPA